MQTIVSGTTTERTARTALMTVLVCGGSAWFLWDGYVTYPRANVESALRDRIGVEPPDPAPVGNPELTPDRVGDIEQGDPLEVIRSRFGEPMFRQNDDVYYFGHGGFLQLEVKADRIADLRWFAGPKYRATDLAIQRVIGFALVPVGLAFLVQLRRVLTTRVSLTESGLMVRGKPLIPFEAMTDVRANPAGKAGRFDVVYSLAGRSGSIRLDDYVVKETQAIVGEICAHRGFPDPLHPEKQPAANCDSS